MEGPLFATDYSPVYNMTHHALRLSKRSAVVVLLMGRWVVRLATAMEAWAVAWEVALKGCCVDGVFHERSS